MSVAPLMSHQISPHITITHSGPCFEIGILWAQHALAPSQIPVIVGPNMGR
jgi:hypothetical protein